MSDTHKLDYHKIVKLLIGPIDPVGESYTDKRRLENLEEVIDLVDCLIGDIERVSRNGTSPEHSVRQIGAMAYRFLKDTEGRLGEELNQ